MRFEPRVAEKEGLQSYQDDSADLVITDIMMPVMNGLEVINALKTVDPEVKIIALTAGSDALNLEAVTRLGAQRVVQNRWLSRN